MAISVDYSVTPWLITIPKSDLTLQSGTKYQLTVDTFWQLLRDYADSEEGIVNSVIYMRIAATASTPSITEVNDDYYVLQFEDGLYSIDVINGNTNIRDVEVKNQVSVATNNTTGFIDPTFLEVGTFDGAVHVNETNGTAGIAYPIGTPSKPSNNWIDAHLIQDKQGLQTFKIYDVANVTGALDFSSGHVFIGFSRVTTSLTIDTSANVLNCEFKNLKIDGTLDGNSVFVDCVVLDVNYINGFIDDSALAGTIILGGNANASIQGCRQQTQSMPVIIDMGGSGQQLSLSAYQGEVIIKNCTGTGQTYVSGSGKVTLDSTITDGTFTIFGAMEVVNNTTGTAVVVDKTVGGSKLDAAALFNEDITPYTTTDTFGEWLNNKGLTVQKFLGFRK